MKLRNFRPSFNLLTLVAGAFVLITGAVTHSISVQISGTFILIVWSLSIVEDRLMARINHQTDILDVVVRQNGLILDIEVEKAIRRKSEEKGLENSHLN